MKETNYGTKEAPSGEWAACVWGEVAGGSGR